jgi:hypothetical protein
VIGVKGFGFGVKDFGFRGFGALGFRVQGSGLRV